MKKKRLQGKIRAYERKIYDQRQLIDISRSFHSELRSDRLIRSMLDICVVHVRAADAAVFLASPARPERFTLAGGYHGFFSVKEPSDYFLRIDSSLVRYFSSGGCEIDFNNIANLLESDPSLIMLERMDTALVVPLKAGGKVNGVVVFGKKPDFESYSAAEREFLLDIATLGGIAVENAQLYERATQDCMTGLKNYAYFKGRLGEDQKWSYREKKPIFLLLIDVDHFKNLNDTYGHRAGDEVLRAVGRVLEGEAGCDGYASRYGGEEFCLVLFVKEIQDAYFRAEKIRSGIENMRVSFESNELSVTVSVGVAALDPTEKGVTADMLVERADQALYYCKRNGRNRINIYGNRQNLPNPVMSSK